MPFVCPDNVATGSRRDFLRSQSCKTGLSSSLTAVTISKPSVGFQAHDERLVLRGAANVAQMRLFFRSHKMQRPFSEVVAKICCTVVFHAKLMTSKAGDRIWMSIAIVRAHSWKGHWAIGCTRLQLHWVYIGDTTRYLVTVDVCCGTLGSAGGMDVGLCASERSVMTTWQSLHKNGFISKRATTKTHVARCSDKIY